MSIKRSKKKVLVKLEDLARKQHGPDVGEKGLGCSESPSF